MRGDLVSQLIQAPTVHRARLQDVDTGRQCRHLVAHPPALLPSEQVGLAQNDQRLRAAVGGQHQEALHTTRIEGDVQPVQQRDDVNICRQGLFRDGDRRIAPRDGRPPREDRVDDRTLVGILAVQHPVAGGGRHGGL